jgi:ribonuclease HI
MKAIDRPQRQSGQAIIKELLDSIDKIAHEHPQLRIIITWIPGHHEIEGNERVDAEAKKAATTPSLGQLYKHKPLKSARVRHIKATSRDQWQKE